MEREDIERLIDEKLAPIHKNINHIKKSLELIVEVIEKDKRRVLRNNLVNINKN